MSNPGEYRVLIYQSGRYDFQIYTVGYVSFGENGEIAGVEGGAESIFDTDPGVVAGALLRMHDAFDKPPIDMRGEKPSECAEVLKT